MTLTHLCSHRVCSQVNSSHEVQLTVIDEPDSSSTKLHRKSGAIPVHRLHSSSDLFIGTACTNATKSYLVLLEETVLAT